MSNRLKNIHYNIYQCISDHCVPLLLRQHHAVSKRVYHTVKNVKKYVTVPYKLYYIGNTLAS